MRGSLLASLFASAAVVGACSVYDTSLFHAPAGSGGNANGGGNNGGGDNGGGGTGANGGAAGNAGVGGGGGCVLKKPPPAPIANDAGTNTGGSEEAVGIMYRIDLGDAKPNITMPPTHFLELGFDVDGICTTSANSKRLQECNIPSYGFGVVDGVGGIDNALGQIVQLTRNQIKNFSSDIYSSQLQQGVTNVIVHVTGYNGQPNDDQVRVETLVSAPFDSPPRAKGTKPKWDGTDEWPIASDSVLNNDVHKPRFVDQNAYVTNGKVVVQLPTTAMRLVVGLTTIGATTATSIVNLDVAMRGAKIVCDLVPVTGDVRIWNWKAHNCTLSARWLVNDLIHQLSHFPDPATGLPLCTDSNLYSTFKDNICGLVDVNSEALSTSDDCTAISMGLTFDTEPGLIGDVYQVSPLKDLCPEGAQPSADNCGQTNDGGVDSGSGSGSGGATGTGGASGTGGKTGTGGAKTDAGSVDASTKD